MKKENKIITLDDFNVNALAEIQGKKELQTLLVKENPFVEITDNASWELAKRSRTLLRTGRTDLEKEKKSVLSKIKEIITEPVSKTYDSFIEITKPHEEKQQAEVKRYEDIKENERLERERIDEARKQTHRDNIEHFFNINKGAIEDLDFETAKTFELEPKINGEIVSTEIFEEFQELFEGKLEVLKIQLNDKVRLLQEREDIRVEQEKIAAAKKEQERVDNIKKSIDNFFTNWSNSISDLNIKNISSFVKSFEDQRDLDCQEFQPLFSEKRAELAKQIEVKIQFIKDQEQLRLDREAIKAEKLQNLIASRTNELVSLGFDKDRAYDTAEFKMIVSEDDLLCEQSEWDTFIGEIKERIRISKIPVITPEEVEIIRFENVNENPIISEVDYEGNIPEPTKEELQALLTKWVLESSRAQLLALCQDLFLIKE